MFFFISCLHSRLLFCQSVLPLHGCNNAYIRKEEGAGVKLPMCCTQHQALTYELSHGSRTLSTEKIRAEEQSQVGSKGILNYDIEQNI